MSHENLSSLAMDLRQVISSIHRKLKEKGHHADLNWSQRHVLRHLYRNSVATVSELAALEGVRTQSMGATVQALKEMGYVCGQPDPQDGRKTLLTLSDAFKEKRTETLLVKEEWLQQQIQDRLAPQEVECLEKALSILNKLIKD